MKPLPHTYQARLIGGPSGYAALSTPGAPDLRSAPPLEHDGLSEAWSPVSLLLAAVEACFLLTLRAVAKASKVEFVSLDLRGEGTVDCQNGVTRFTEIVLRPRLELASGGDRDRALRVLEKSKKACLVMASLSTPVRMVPDIMSRLQELPTLGRGEGVVKEPERRTGMTPGGRRCAPSSAGGS
jgi:uncharacterized OsmC-like protein